MWKTAFSPSHSPYFSLSGSPSPLLFPHLIFCTLFPFFSPHVLSSFLSFFSFLPLFVFLSHVFFSFFYPFWLLPPLKTWGGNHVVWGHYVPHYIYFYIFLILSFLFFFFVIFYFYFLYSLLTFFFLFLFFCFLYFYLHFAKL